MKSPSSSSYALGPTVARIDPRRTYISCSQGCEWTSTLDPGLDSKNLMAYVGAPSSPLTSHLIVVPGTGIPFDVDAGSA